jgi:hypothetical protein
MTIDEGEPMSDRQSLLHAKDVLRGHVSGGISIADLQTAGRRVLVEMDRLYRISVWAARLVDAVDAADDAAAEKARRGLKKALREF